MSPMDALRDAIDPALAELPPPMTSDAARAMLVAIGLQESLWQFERNDGVRGVLVHEAIRSEARAAWERRDLPASATAVYMALETDDVLAAVFARLLLWTDPLPLPDDMDAGWSYYLRNWRPGKPHPQTWPAFYRRAVQAVQESAA